MDNTNGRDWMDRRRIQWLSYQLVALFLYALATTLGVGAIALCFMAVPVWAYPVSCALFFSGYVYLSGVTRLSYGQLAGMLDIRFPQLEHSSALLLKPRDALATLQLLQRDRISRVLADVPGGKFIDHRRWYRPLGLTLGAAVLYLMVAYAVVPRLHRDELSDMPGSGRSTRVPLELPAMIASARVSIQPPAYTALPPVEQAVLDITAPVGSTIGLQLTTGAPIGRMTLVLDGKTEIDLKSQDADSLRWAVRFKPQKSGFYQLSLDGELSALYPLELTPDLPVSIRVSQPEQHTVIDLGFPEVIALNASLHDDYAIRTVQLMATVSSGKGEGVSFKSQEIPLHTVVQGKKQVQVNQKIDLKKLGMVSGDELYFYLKADDSFGQESRSDVFVVVLQDTAELFSMAGMVSGVDLVPEYFRSQRQIIIDTEKLIAELDTLPTATAHNRSNNLGIDQQLLRLRYGQFLGEEAEDNIGGHIGHDHDHGHLPKDEVVSHANARNRKNHDPNHEGHEEHAHEFDKPEKPEVPVDVQALIAEMSHQHDRAEDATFFDAEQKAHLKATLTEMWNTELRLRTYKPQEALPYAYKALRLLKELQQKSRVFVGKAPTKTTPLNPEKRLSADLETIYGNEQRYPVSEVTDVAKIQQRLRRTLAYLSNLKVTQQLDEPGRQLLIEAERSVMEAASIEPTKYLGALQAIRLLEEHGGKNSGTEIQLVEKAIHELLPALGQQPAKQTSPGGNAIYRIFFEQLTGK